MIQIHNVKDNSRSELSPNQLSELADASPVRCLDKNAEKNMINTIDVVRLVSIITLPSLPFLLFFRLSNPLASLLSSH